MSALEVIASLIVIIALAVIITKMVKGQTMKLSYPVMQSFEQRKQLTLVMLRDFHTDCILASTIPTIEEFTFGFAERDKSIQAWVYPNVNGTPTMWFNTRIDWSENFTIVAIVHEALHWTKDKNGNFICGPDRYRQKESPWRIPVCSPFGKKVYDTEELTKEVARHLGLVI